LYNLPPVPDFAVNLPGPSGLAWALELGLFAGAFLPAGELLRRVASRWVSLFRDLGWTERLLLDLYLGGGGLYLIAVVPLGLFRFPVVAGYLVGAAVILAAVYVGRRERPRVPPDVPPSRVRFRLLPGLVTAAATLALFAVEVTVADGVPTGNSFDTSILTDYVALLLLHHQVPISFVPIAPQLTSYPQGAPVWLAAAQWIFVLPPARTPLLVTPLFLSLAPLSGYVLGRRQLGSPWAGAAIGLTFALIATWTRVMVATSNDFVFSFPLVLWLWARVDLWKRPRGPPWPDALAFGAVMGYSAALNPVGAEWIFPILVLLGLLSGGVRWNSLRGAVPRWLGALGIALLFVAPALWALFEGGGNLFASSAGVKVPAPTGLPGISPAQLVGSADPFLFRARDIWLSPFPAIRFELAILLVAGAAVLVIPPLGRRLGSAGRSFREWVAASLGVALLILLAEVGASLGAGPLDALALVSSAAEVSIYLFAIYTVIAALPVYLLVAYFIEKTPAPPAALDVAATSPVRSFRSRTAPPTGMRAIALGLVVVLLVPGAVVTGTDFPAYLETLYGNFGRVTAADFAMFAWAAQGLPTGARVLVAPGSAAQFLPGYANVQLVYPVQRIAQNASYVDLDRQLVQGHLNSTAYRELGWLAIQYVVVTGNTTNLWAPFSPAALSGPPFRLVFQQGDAYVFAY
jgi:hypothetical protein